MGQLPVQCSLSAASAKLSTLIYWGLSWPRAVAAKLSKFSFKNFWEHTCINV